MSDRKKAFWFIALLSVLVVVPFWEKPFFIPRENRGRRLLPFLCWKVKTGYFR